MPFALVTLGLLMIVSGARNTHAQLGKMVSEDFTGQDNFLFWLAGFGAVGALGYYEPARTFSRALMGLLLVVMLLANGGFFAKFREAIATATPGQGASPAQEAAASPLGDFMGALGQNLQAGVSDGSVLGTLDGSNARLGGQAGARFGQWLGITPLFGGGGQ